MLERPPQNGGEERGSGTTTEEQPIAMKIALEKAKSAKKESVAFGKSVGEELWKTLSDSETVQKISGKAAGDNRKNEESRKPDLQKESAPKPEEPFDVNSYSGNVMKTYVGLNRYVRKQIKNKARAADVLRPADETFAEIKKLSEEYGKASGPEAKADISAKIQVLGVRLEGEIKQNVRKAAERPTESDGKKKPQSKSAKAAPKEAPLIVGSEPKAALAAERVAPPGEPLPETEEGLPTADEALLPVGEESKPGEHEGELMPQEEAPAVFRSNRREKASETPAELPIIPNPEDAIDREHVRGLLGEDKTPKEWKNELRGLIEKTLAANPSEAQRGRLEKMQKYLEARSEISRTEAKKLGLLERGFDSLRWVGEKYNKVNWKTKLAVGLSLGLGGAASATVSLPAAFACIFAIGAQRALGMTGMFVHFENHLKNVAKGESEGFFGGKLLGKESRYQEFIKKMDFSEKGRRNVALLMAMGYTTSMSATIGEGVQLASESSWGEAVHNWLGNMLGHQAPVHGHEAVGTISHPSAITSEVAQPAAAAAAGEPLAAHLPEMSTVGASSHGYEGMLKELWQRVHEPGFHAPENLDENSDLAQLLKADEASLDKVVHEMSGSRDVGGIHGHHFFNPDGTSVRIDADAHMTIGLHGEIHLEQGGHDFVDAPSEAPTVPVPHPKAPPAPLASHPETPTSVSAAHPSAPEAAHEVNPVTGLVDEQPPAPVETATPQPVTQVHDTLVDSSGTPVVDSQGMPVRTGSYEPSTHAAPAAEHGASVPEDHTAVSAAEHPSVFVDPNTPHIYSTPDNRLYVFGGPADALDAQAQEYALKHHVSVFVDKSYKLLGFIDTPRVVEYASQPDGSVVMVVHSGPSLVPDPQKFTERVF